MATQYLDNIAKSEPHPFGIATPTVVRKIDLSDSSDALRLGSEDFTAVPSHAIILCVIYPVLGVILFRLVLGYSVLPLLFPLAARSQMLRSPAPAIFSAPKVLLASCVGLSHRHHGEAPPRRATPHTWPARVKRISVL